MFPKVLRDLIRQRLVYNCISPLQHLKNNMMKPLICALCVPIMAVPAAAQTASRPVIVSGTCDVKSGVKINDNENNSFSCDTAIIAPTQRGTVLIQFTDKVGDDGRILGFAGTIEGKQGLGADATQMIAVERVYLAGGANPITASRGTCIMNWSGLLREGGRVTSVLCAARAQSEGYDIQAMAMLEAQ
jgi:hypothetical protein